MFRELLENTVSNCISQPYCNLCMTEHSSLEDALHHIATEKHKVAKNKRDTELLVELGVNSEEWLLLVQNNTVVCELSNARCVLCEKRFGSLIKAFRHICKKKHKNKLNNQNKKLNTVKSKDEKQVMNVKSEIDAEKNGLNILKIEDMYQDVAISSPRKRLKIEDTYQDAAVTLPHEINIKIEQEDTSNNSEKCKNYDSITFNNPVHEYSEEHCRLFVNNGIMITGPFQLICSICQDRFPWVAAYIDHFCKKRHLEALKRQAALELKAESNYESKNVKSPEIKHTILVNNKLATFRQTHLICVPCTVMFSSLYDTLKHIDKKKHIDALNINEEHKDSTYSATIIELNNYSEKIHQEFMDNKIEIVGSHHFYCLFCERYFLELKGVLGHIKAKLHNEKKVIEYIDTVNLQINADEEKSEIQHADQDTKTENLNSYTEEECQILGDNKIVTYGPTYLICVPCEMMFSSLHDTLKHVNKKKHIKALNINEEHEDSTYSTAITELNNYSEKVHQEFMDNKIEILGSHHFHCLFCEQHLSELKDVLGHIKGKLHNEKKFIEYVETVNLQIDEDEEMSDIQNAHQDTKTESLNNYSEEECQILVDNKIAVLGPTHLMCALCERLFSSLSITLQHINEKCHVNALEHQDAEQFVSESTDKNHDGYVNGKNSRQDRTTTLAQETSTHQEHNVNDNEKHQNRTCVTAVTNLKDYSEKKRQQFVDNKIEIIGLRCFRCLLCKRIYRSLKSFSDHIKGKHKSVAKYHEKKIDATKKQNISQVASVNLHINAEKGVSKLKHKNQETTVTMPQETILCLSFSEDECQNGTDPNTRQQPSLDNSIWDDKWSSEPFADGAHKTEHFNS